MKINKLKHINFSDKMLESIKQESEKLGLTDSAYIRLAVAKQLGGSEE